MQANPVSIHHSEKVIARDMVLHDLNGDGYPELIVGCFNTPNCVFLNCSGKFDPTPAWRAEGTDPTFRVHVYPCSENAGQINITFGKSRGGEIAFYRVANQTAVDLKDRVEPVAQFELYQNYPNPFNGNTRLTYDLNHAARVRVELYNVAGKQVSTLVDEWRERGRHELIIDGGKWPSGVYYCRLYACNRMIVIKMALLR